MLFIPTYFGAISQYIAIFNSDEIIFEVEDNFQKQTYRNRCYIYGANGKLQLNIPISHQNTIQKPKTKDIKIDNSISWQKQHFKTLHSAYRSSPFYEFYIDDLRPIYEQKHTFLLDFNLKCYEVLMDSLQENISYSRTSTYETNPKINNGRIFSIAKKEPKYNFKKYTQVFNNKHGFISNLCILDLLFMEGPNTNIYLLNKANFNSINLICLNLF